MNHLIIAFFSFIINKGMNNRKNNMGCVQKAIEPKIIRSRWEYAFGFSHFKSMGIVIHAILLTNIAMNVSVMMMYPR